MIISLENERAVNYKERSFCCQLNFILRKGDLLVVYPIKILLSVRMNKRNIFVKTQRGEDVLRNRTAHLSKDLKRALWMVG